MARIIDLTELPTTPGRYGLGKGLWLQVRDAVQRDAVLRSWIYRYKINGHTHWVGLGTLDEVSVVEARALCAHYAAIRRRGEDPLQARRADRERTAPKRVPTFEAEAKAFLNVFMPSWHNATHRQQWENTLATYVYPVLGKIPVSNITSGQVMKVLEPIWERIPLTADRVRQRIERILGSAIAKGHRTAANPARWRDHLDKLLPDPDEVHEVEHFPAMPWKEVPVFMKELRLVQGHSASALEFCILTAARPGMVRQARWSEFDLAARRWTVPVEHMKKTKKKKTDRRRDKPFLVPLSDAACAVLRSMEQYRRSPDGYVFPGAIPGAPLSDMAMNELMRDMCGADRRPPGVLFRDPESGRIPVPHGTARSSFADWAGEATYFPAELVEAALAHVAGDAVRMAYRRGDSYELRVQLMQSWADFCGRDQPDATDGGIRFQLPPEVVFPTRRDLEQQAGRLANLLVGIENPEARDVLRALQAFLGRPDLETLAAAPPAGPGSAKPPGPATPPPGTTPPEAAAAASVPSGRGRGSTARATASVAAAGRRGAPKPGQRRRRADDDGSTCQRALGLDQTR